MTSRFEPGTLIDDRFEIERLVATGGMGTVYCSYDRASGDRVALKLLSGSAGQHKESERFLREARILSELRHPNIVSYVAHGATDDGQLYLAMQWLEGEDLARRLKRGPLSQRDCIVVMQRIAAALEVAHERSIVHRDLKPSNIFLRDGQIEQAILLDFGVARAPDSATALTSTGLLVGTPNYMSPEQARGARDIQPAADVFSLGCVLYECLTGRPPFLADHVAAVLGRILFDDPAPLRGARPALPELWEALVSRMLKKDPNERLRNAMELSRELADIPPVSEGNTTVIERITSPSIPPWSGSEQEFVSVLLVIPEAPVSIMPTVGRAEDEDPLQLHVSALKSALLRFGVDVEPLVDGSLIASVALKGSATDQAIVGARAALLLRERMPRARIAVATGLRVRSQRAPVGDAIDRAVKLLQNLGETSQRPAPTGEIWLDDVTANLLDSRFVLTRAAGGAILEEERMAADDSRPLLGKPTPCVGRERELDQLASVLGRCVEDSEAQAVLVTAVPGAGKSRLRHELLRRQRAGGAAHRVLIGYGDPLSTGSPYWMLSEALRRSADIHYGDEPSRQRTALTTNLCRNVGPEGRRRVSEFLGELCGVAFPGEDSPPLQAARSDPRAMSEQIEQAFLDWLEAECATSPVLLVLEDLHWGDALTVKLVDAALRAHAERPLFVLGLARPEVAERFPRLWQRCLQTIVLRPLTQKASERLVREVLGERQMPAKVLDRIVERAAGNALFLEELIRAAVEGKPNEVPETVLAVLQARLRRLSPESRRVLRAASIFGTTFWASGVQLLCGGGEPDNVVAGCLQQLVQSEIIAEHRSSHFPRESEYGFHHALVRDAAYSLLTEADRAEGHRLACAYLERMGEQDSMVLAEHAERGGDLERAGGFFRRAAEQSIEQNDLDQALARAARGVACGAKGEPLGTLRAIQSLAFFGKAEWSGASEAGTEALALLPRGSLWWCRLAERLFNVFPLTGHIDRFQQLVRDFAEIEPAPDAIPAYVSADAYLLMMFAFLGSREGCQGCLERIQRFGASSIKNDTHVRATFNLFRGWFVYTLEPDPYVALSLAEDSLQGFVETRDSRGRALAASFLGISQAALGGFEEGEKSLRESLALAEEMHDAFHAVNARGYLIVVLVESGDPERLAEVEEMARSVRDANLNVGYVAIAHMGIAAAYLAEGKASQAEAEVRRSLELFATVPPYSFMGRRVMLEVLKAQGRLDEAAAVAGEGLDALAKLGGAGWTEVPFRVAASEALRAAGDIDGARSALEEALRQIERRASRIPDPAWRERFLTQRPENVRASALARGELVDK